MISVVLYGRNDSYGYNLHKRAALSLNCISEILTHEGDEILFVDYNTPDDFPTFPEAIQDTLTPRARQLLRILRVRPKHHQRFKDRTHLVALEPVARNVAVRRSNPGNRWILSTNTDMIFVPRGNQSLSDIAADLPDGFYHLPRFEVPESLWESLDRADPGKTIAQIEAWGRGFHLNEVVHAHDPWVKFDGPGDFQLILRSDLFRISGFHEEMLLGWHVDSNIARRLHLRYGKTGDVLDRLFGYHCDHTRQVTPAHRAGSVQNDLAKFNDSVRRAELPEQAASWGLADETIEELTADRTSALYIAGLDSAIVGELVEPLEVTYAGPTYDTVDYEECHVLPFVTDIFASYPRDTQVGWFPTRPILLEAFAAAFRRMGFENPVLVAHGAEWIGADLPAGCAWMDPLEILEQATAFVFDFGQSQPSADEPAHQPYAASVFVALWFRRAARAESELLADDGVLPRRFVAVNAIHNRFESMVGQYINAARSPMASRIRQGFAYARDKKGHLDLLPLLSIGDAGKRDSGRIVSQPGKAGFVTYGPYRALDAFQYRLKLTFAPAATDAVAHSGNVVVEIFSAPYLFGAFPIGDTVQAGGTVSLPFSLSEDLLDAVPWVQIEFRIRTDGRIPVALTAAQLEEVAPAEDTSVDCELLPLLHRGPASDRLARMVRIASKLAGTQTGRRVGDVRAAFGKRGYVVFGPYVAIPPGRYEATFGLRTYGPRLSLRRGSAYRAAVDVVTKGGGQTLAHCYANPASGRPTVLPFEIPAHADEPDLLEFRVWSGGSIGFAVQSINLRRLSPGKPGTTNGESAE